MLKFMLYKAFYFRLLFNSYHSWYYRCFNSRFLSLLLSYHISRLTSYLTIDLESTAMGSQLRVYPAIKFCLEVVSVDFRKCVTLLQNHEFCQKLLFAWKCAVWHADLFRFKEKVEFVLRYHCGERKVNYFE